MAARAPRPDADTPDGARVWDVLGGGASGFAADRDLAASLAAVCPGLTGAVRENRAFISRAVTWTAGLMGGRGVPQFADIGCGVRSVVHETARACDQRAVTCYADNDPGVLSRARALLAADGASVVEGDVTRPAELLAALGEALDLSGPVCVVLGAVLHAMRSGEARCAVAALMSPLASGSVAVISVPHIADEAVAERVAGLYAAAGPWFNHSAENVRSFLHGSGLRVVHRERGMDTARWPLPPPALTGPVAVLGGVGLKD
jgi:hypothetical protein